MARLYNILGKLPYAEVENLLAGEAKAWFNKAFRPKKRGVGILKTKEAEKWGTKEYYIARMVRFMVEPWDNIPIIAEVFASGWPEEEVKALDEAVKEITSAIWNYIKASNPRLFQELAGQIEYVCGLYGVNNIIEMK